MMTEQRGFIEQSKRLHESAQIRSLILKDDGIEATTPKIILELLVSQYATALTDSCLMNMCNEPYQCQNKLPLPIVFAIFKQQITSGQTHEALKLLQVHIDRKSLEKVFILIYNLTKIYELQGQYPKQSFYLETLLKQEPFFPEAVHDLAIVYAFHLNRLNQAIILLQRHLNSVNAHNPLIHAAYIRCLDLSNGDFIENTKILQNKNMTLTNYFNLGLLLRKKGALDRSSYIFQELIRYFDSSFTTLDEKDQKLLLLSKINLIKVRQDQNRLNEASLLASILLDADSENLDTKTAQKIAQINEKKNALEQCLSSHKKGKPDVFKISKKKNKDSYSVQKKQEGSAFESILYQVKERNDKKLKHLVQKQKSIDKFFKNIMMKFSTNSQQLQISLKNSLKAAKKQLDSCKKDFDAEQYQRLEEQFQKSRLQHCSQLEGCDIEQSIRIILLNLQNLKHGQHFKTEMSGYSRAETMLYKQAKISVRGNISTASVQKRQNLAINKHRKQPTDRGTAKFRIKICPETPPQQQLATQSKVKGPKVDDKINMKTEIFSFHGKRSIFEQQKKQQEEQIKSRKEDIIIKENPKEQQKREEIKQIQSISQRTDQETVLLEEQNHKIIEQNTTIPAPLSSLFMPFSDNKSPEIESQQDEVQYSARTSSNKLSAEDKITQRIFEDKCLQEQSEKKIQLKKISFKKNQDIKRSEENIVKEIKTSFKKIDTSKNSVKNIDSGKFSQKKVELIKSSENKLSNKKNIEQRSLNKIETFKEDGKKEAEADKMANISRRQSPRQPSESNFFDKTPSSYNISAQNMMASSFNLNTASLATFKNKPVKKSKLAGESTFAKAMEGLTPQIKKKQTSTLSAEFHVQMLKIAQLQRRQEWDKAYDKLLQIYKNFKKEDEKIETLLRIGSIFEKQEKFPEAEKTYLKCSKFNSADAFLSLGNLQLKIGKIDQGVQNLEKANCIRRFDLTIENKLVYGYSLRQDTMDKALKLAHCILKKQPNSLETLLITAGILEKQGLIDEAIQIVKAIDQVRQTEHIKHYLGILHLAASNLKEAFEYFKQALAIKPDYAPSLIETASIISQAYPKQAIAVLNKAIQISPGNRRALARLGKIYQAESDFDNAMTTYKAGLETQANYESYMKIGDCLAKKQSYIEALLNYKEAIGLKKTPEAYAKLALMFQYKNDFLKAIENYQAALAVLEPSKDSFRKDYLLAIGRLHLKMGQYETAIISLDELLETTESTEVFQLLGEAYFGNRQYHESLSYFQRANTLAGGLNLEIMESMAMCLDKLEEYLASKVIYQKILEKVPNNVRCLNNLANILLITGETNEAFFLFESALEKTPKNIEKRLKLADIYAEVGDWSKVEYHLIQCYRQKQHDVRILEKLVVLYKEKRDNKMSAKYEKKLALLKTNHKHKVN